MAKVRLILVSLLTLLFCSCERDGLDVTLSVGPYGGERHQVLLLYEAGYNTLSSYITRNIDALRNGYLPEKGKNDDVVLVFSHLCRTSRDFYVETAPVLLRLYSRKGMPAVDTLKVWPVGTSIANPAMVTEVFNWVKDAFPAAVYGAVLASHGSGWLPEGYYDNAKQYEGKDRAEYSSWVSSPFKTFGQEFASHGSEIEEIEIKDLAVAIPYQLDYILFDACFMAAVEVAWELRGVCRTMAASPCEVPGAGFDYSTLVERLLKPEVPDVAGVCADYYALYETSHFGAAISWIDCQSLNDLAGICRTLFEKYRTAIRNLSGTNVKRFDNKSNHAWCAFFDLKDMLREAGAASDELAALQAALDKALLYENHTKKFLSVDLENTCGLSVYLPSYPDHRADLMHGTAFLDSFYKENIAWNQATALVE